MTIIWLCACGISACVGWIAAKWHAEKELENCFIFEPDEEFWED